MDAGNGNLDVAVDLRAARDGDLAALGRLLQGCRGYLLSLANASLDSALSAKIGGSDLVQQSLLEAQEGFGQFSGTSEADFLRWLKRILTNNIRDHARRYRADSGRDVGKEISLNDEPAAVRLARLMAENDSPLKGLISLEKKAALEAGVANLPEECRLVIEMHHVQGRTFQEIGDVLGKSAEAARKIWFRALKQLGRELKRHEEFGSSI